MKATHCPKGNRNMTLFLTANDVNNLNVGLMDIPRANQTVGRLMDYLRDAQRHFNDMQLERLEREGIELPFPDFNE